MDHNSCGICVLVILEENEKRKQKRKKDRKINKKGEWRWWHFALVGNTDRY
jgi:hypothetical protein